MIYIIIKLIYLWVSLKVLLKYVLKYSDILVFLYNKINN